MKRWNTSKPLRMWIDGKCFNIKPYNEIRFGAKKCASEKDIGSMQQELQNNYLLNPIDDGKLLTQFRLPSRYYKCLTNFPMFSVKRLEQETQTIIKLPEANEEGFLTISGESETNIIYAREHIHSVVGEIREKEFVQQFIAIPVHSEEVKKNFEQFKKDILSGDLIEGIDTSIFQSPLKLHLTIAVFSLLDESEKSEAIAALSDCKTQIIEPTLREIESPFKIRVAGIECMNNDLSKVNVLYAKAKLVHEENVLQKLADNIANFFYDRGLIRQYKENVKLHVTLMNTRYRKHSGDQNNKSPRKRSKWYIKRKSFDARTIVEKYKDYDFGETVLDTVHLSYMSSVGEDGFYKPLSIITL